MQDRQIVLTRLIKAPVQMVWKCWTDPAILPKWFGPEGYSCTTKEIDLQVGGQWRFDMIGPDGTVWANRHRYHVMDPYARIEFLMDADSDDDTPKEVVVDLTPEDGGTRLVQTMTLASKAERDGALGYGADKLGATTMAKLAAMAEAMVV